MNQLLQNLSTGKISLAEVPIPTLRKGSLLIASHKTLVSAGTERMLVEFGKANFISKALQQPDKVKMILGKVKTDGLMPTINAVRSKLDQPLALGYCNAGIVLESGVDSFQKGDRVVSNGNHSEVVLVPEKLCAKIPDGVDDESAAFTVLAAVGLQGIRLIKPTLGETVVVLGLGLIGLLTVQMLRANGCRVLGVDFDSSRCHMARQFGAECVDLSKGEDPIEVAHAFTRGRGVDAVVVAATTKSNDLMHQAAQMCRKRARIVLVGLVGLSLRRDDFFKKELTFQVSASYGPGRYDPNYEEKGQDYPIGFVRWTEQRNFEAVLDMMASGTLNVKPLISHRFTISEADKAYELLGGGASSLGILLAYPGIEISESSRTVSLSELGGLRGSRVLQDEGGGENALSEICVRAKSRQSDMVAPQGVVSFLGSGNYASSVLIPAFKAAGAVLRSVASSSGISSVHVGHKFRFRETTTNSDRLFSDGETDAIVIATRHDSHARYVLQALRANKHVFVEKPLCLTLGELEEIRSATRHRDDEFILMVGFNRRFSPHIQKIKQLLSAVSAPKSFIMTVNAGAIPGDHWTQEPLSGGGRIIGEACHFIDLLRFLAATPIVDFDRSFINSATRDTATITLKFADGSVGTIHYFANGSKLFPKERLEVFTAGRVLALNNFRKLTGYGWPGFSRMNLWRQDKGQVACVKAFVDAIKASQGDASSRHSEEAQPMWRSSSPIALHEVLEVAEVTIKLAS